MSIFGSIFVCVGIYVLFFWRRQLLKEKQAANWPVVNGKVIESHVIVGDKNDAYDVLKFIYAYEFSGKKHTSSTVDFFEFPSRLTNSELRDFSEKYPMDSTVNVYCNPLDGTGIMHIKSSENSNRTRNMGVFLLTIGGAFLSFAVKLT